MKYNIGDKVRIKSLDWYNENKGPFGELCPDFIVFLPSRSKYCGQIMTIKEVLRNSYNSDLIYYKMIEDAQLNDWTNGMIEGLVEDECPQDFIEKYCKSCGTQRCDRTKEYLNGCPYYNAYVCKKQNNTMKEESSIDLTVKGEEAKKRIEITIPEGYEYVIESGKIIFTKKKTEYPKTYTECSDILSVYTDPDISGYKGELLWAFQKLLICRDAYWKIAGEVMGLGKPWEPDWNTSEPKYVISCTSNGIEKQWETTYCKGFAFPTTEMRDAFKENFDSDLEICKELL